MLTATLDFGVKDMGAECTTTLDFVEQYLQMVSHGGAPTSQPIRTRSAATALENLSSRYEPCDTVCY